MQTNSTIYRETSAEEVEELIKFLTDVGVDGMLLTPGSHYQVLENDIYLKNEKCPASSDAFATSRMTIKLLIRQFTSTIWSANATCYAVRGRR